MVEDMEVSRIAGVYPALRPGNGFDSLLVRCGPRSMRAGSTAIAFDLSLRLVDLEADVDMHRLKL